MIRRLLCPRHCWRSETRYGFEGIALVGDTLWMAVQREWKDDPKGMVKLLAYNTKEETWGAVHYPLDAAAEGAWMGLSEITVKGDWAYIVERDNQIADKAATKKLYRVAVSQLAPARTGRHAARGQQGTGAGFHPRSGGAERLYCR